MVSSRKAIAIDVSELVAQIAAIKDQLVNVNNSVSKTVQAERQVLTTIVQLQVLGEQATTIHDRLTESSPNLLTIPQEVRDDILKDLLLDSDYVELKGRNGPRYCKDIAKNYLALSLSSTQLRDDVAEMF